jgi:ornithine cyclodeaminase/alanine dehydrogenase-like protein (mu-crystallin family)
LTPDTGFTHLSDTDLAALGITPAEVVSAIENAVIKQAAGQVWAAPKVSVLPGDGRYMMATLAVSDDPQIIAVKSVMVSPDNPSRGLPGINGAIMLLDSVTGQLVCVMGANWVTGVRTAGLSAVMARRLANPQSTSIAFIGTGVQARSHLDVFVEFFPLNEVRIFGRGRANIDLLAADAEGRGMGAVAFDDPKAAIATADIIVSSITLSYDTEPFLDARWLKPGAFLTTTDLAIPWVDAGMGAFASLYVDDQAQEAAMEKPMVDTALIKGDLQSVVTGAVPARYDANARAAFVFRGIAIGDLAVAGLAYARATA